MPQKAAIPADIEAIIAGLNNASRHAEELFASVPADALERSPAPRRWSAAQCLAHLAVTNFTYLAAMRTAIKPALHLRNHERSGPLRAGLPTRLFLAHLEPPVGKRIRTRGALVPPPSIDARAALKEFLRSQAAVIELLMECRHLDLNKIRFANPFVPGLRFTVGAGFLIIAAHDRRHLWQAAQGLPVVATSKQ
ncbi:MAG: DinB family protein [Bryobacteraceae bacterium]